MSIGGFDPEILQDFLTESGELLEQLEGDLVDLEDDPTDPEMLNQIFRALHTIKGSASFLALTNLVELAHAAESALNAARGGQATIGKGEMDLLLEAVDILKKQFDELNSGGTELTKAPDPLVQGLTAIGEGQSIDADAPQEAAAAEPAAAAADGADGADGADTPAPLAGSATGVAERRLELDASKEALLDHLVTDLDDTLDKISEQLGRLANESERDAAANAIGELGDDLTRTVDFFEFDEMLQLSKAIAEAGEQFASLDDEARDQLVPRIDAIAHLLTEQSTGLKSQRLVTRPTDALLERVHRLLTGEALSDAERVAAAADRQAVLTHDGVLSEGASDPGPGADAGAAPSSAPAAPQAAAAAPPDAAPAADDDASAPAEQAARRASAPAIEQTIRVEVGRLEALMNLVGELVLQKNRVLGLSQDLNKSGISQELSEQIEVTAGTLDRVTGDIQVAVMRTRMQPLDKLFGKYPRLIRDLARKTDKDIRLDIEGRETEVDKSVIEELGDPLVHLLRNSGDHGIESPAERSAAGKPEQGVIKLCASHEGSHVSVRIIDDGRGLDRDKIGKKAVERGLVTADQLATTPDEEVFRYIFEPGFSTADQVSDLSGRGVGMDVVRTNIEKKLKGTITIESERGKGTTINIAIPLTVAIMPAMMVAIAHEVYAIPLGNITEIVRPDAEQLSTIGGGEVIRLRGTVLPLLSAQGIFDIEAADREPEPFIVVLAMNDKQVGLRVGRVIGQQEIVIKPLDGVDQTGPVSGATVRNDGSVSLIVDVGELIRRTR